MSVPGGIKPGDIQDLSDQVISFDEHAQSVIFFVTEINFADGSHWNERWNMNKSSWEWKGS
jgi:hypothetical protein